MSAEPGPWPVGAEIIGRLIAEGKLDQGVYVAPVTITGSFEDAERHLASAAALKGSDPKLAYSGMYDGVRKEFLDANPDYTL